jgi:acyl-CoA synthetase (AMP-forming)/AMP-acid ligase II
MHVGLELARIPARGNISLFLDDDTLYTAPQYKRELDTLRKLCRTLHPADYGCVTINNLHSLPLQRRFEVNAQTFPGAPAVKAGNQLLTYGELDHQADELALYLQRRGLHAGCFCIVRLEPSIAEVRVILAILKAGAAYVKFDPGLGPQLEAAVFDVLEPPFLFVPVTEALRPEAGRLQVVGCADGPMDLPYGWPDEARVDARTPACAVVYREPGGGVCISMRTHQSLAFPARGPARSRRSTGGRSPRTRHDPTNFWQVFSKGALMVIPHA